MSNLPKGFYTRPSDYKDSARVVPVTDHEALERIARLLLEPADYDNDPRADGPELALDALGWLHWECSSRFTGCRASAVGPVDDLLADGWVRRDGEPRCPTHAATTDPTQWPPGHRARFL